MNVEKPYNPLDTLVLGNTVADALLAREVTSLAPEEPFYGAGVYAIYYTGDFEPYQKIAALNRDDRFQQPIYVGKAIPKGGRKGRFGLTRTAEPSLFNRLVEHADSIKAANNLEITDFCCQYLVVEDIWIPLGESLLISRFSPVWNQVLDGFGNHDPGSGRYNQKRSPWDVVHPGRPWADRLRAHPVSAEDLVQNVIEFLDRGENDVEEEETN